MEAFEKAARNGLFDVCETTGAVVLLLPLGGEAVLSPACVLERPVQYLKAPLKPWCCDCRRTFPRGSVLFVWNYLEFTLMGGDTICSECKSGRMAAWGKRYHEWEKRSVKEVGF